MFLAWDTVTKTTFHLGSTSCKRVSELRSLFCLFVVLFCLVQQCSESIANEAPTSFISTSLNEQHGSRISFLVALYTSVHLSTSGSSHFHLRFIATQSLARSLECPVMTCLGGWGSAPRPPSLLEYCVFLTGTGAAVARDPGIAWSPHRSSNASLCPVCRRRWWWWRPSRW